MLGESTNGAGAEKVITSRKVIIKRIKTQNPVSRDLEDRLKFMVTLLGSKEGVFCLTLVHTLVQPFGHFN
jgi:hypothetical protein